MTSNITDNDDIIWVNELLNWANEDEKKEVFNCEIILIKKMILEIKVYLDSVITRSNQIEFALYKLNMVTLSIEKMKNKIIYTNQKEQSTLLHKIMMSQMSYIVIARAFLTLAESVEIIVIKMVEKTIEVALMVIENKETKYDIKINTQKIIVELREMMIIWKDKVNQAFIAKNDTVMAIISETSQIEPLNIPEITKEWVTEISKRNICNKFITIVNQWITEYSYNY